MLLDKYKKYEALRGDVLIISQLTYHSEVYKSSKSGEIYLKEIELSERQKLRFIKSYFYSLKIDLMKTHKKIIVDTHDLDVFDVIRNFESDCDIYCLGMPNETPEMLYNKIRENDRNSDWSKYVSDETLKSHCEEIVKESKKIYRQCQKTGVTFFDTSGNRKEKIMKAMKVIEANSIEC